VCLPLWPAWDVMLAALQSARATSSPGFEVMNHAYPLQIKLVLARPGPAKRPSMGRTGP